LGSGLLLVLVVHMSVQSRNLNTLKLLESIARISPSIDLQFSGGEGQPDSSTNHLASIVKLVKPYFKTSPGNFVEECDKYYVIDKPLKEAG